MPQLTKPACFRCTVPVTLWMEPFRPLGRQDHAHIRRRLASSVGCYSPRQLQVACVC
jgi:hypothetical protein